MSATITRREIPNNTTEQIHGYLTTAEEILRLQGYDPKVNERLLCTVVQLVSGKQVIMEQSQPIAVDLAALRAGPNGH